MGKRLIERQLRATGTRLRSLRDELGTIDVQLAQLRSDADDLSSDAAIGVVGAQGEHRRAAEHAETMARHRAKVVAEIASLEQRQDQLLDRLTAG